MLLMMKSYTNQEGDDVYFECLIVSNPTATRLEWYHRVSTEQQDDHQKKKERKMIMIKIKTRTTGCTQTQVAAVESFSQTSLSSSR